MAEIAPFRGIRYNTELVRPDDVTSPPYDVISPADLDYFLNRHPKNVVRLILGQELPGDGANGDRFTRAGQYLDEWLAEGTLAQDPRPALYVYEQRYTESGRLRTVRGFTALVKLHGYSENVILPHESTLDKPKSHLTPLITATNANLDSVYGLYPDPERVVDGVLDFVAQMPPAAEATDRQQVRHRLWVLSSEKEIGLVTQALAGRPVVIADGHHRYETALAYRDAMREKYGGSAGEQPYDYAMMTLVNLHAPDLLVLPTHRMVSNLLTEEAERLEERLAERFHLLPSSRDGLMPDMERRRGEAIGVYRPGRAYLAVPKQPPSRRGLDVTILHREILDGMLGIDADRLRRETNLAYTRDGREALDAVDSGECQIAFVLGPVSLDAMLEAVLAGGRMPQKSTYFYPKLLSGLVMRRIE